MVSTIAASPDPTSAVKELQQLWKEQKVYKSVSQGQERTVEEMLNAAVEMFELLKAESKKPLVHHITVRR